MTTILSIGYCSMDSRQREVELKWLLEGWKGSQHDGIDKTPMFEGELE